MVAPLQVLGEEDAKVGIVGHMLQDRAVESVVEVRLLLYAEDVTLRGIEAHPPGICPYFELFEALL